MTQNFTSAATCRLRRSEGSPGASHDGRRKSGPGPSAADDSRRPTIPESSTGPPREDYMHVTPRSWRMGQLSLASAWWAVASAMLADPRCARHAGHRNRRRDHRHGLAAARTAASTRSSPLRRPHRLTSTCSPGRCSGPAARSWPRSSSRPPRSFACFEGSVIAIALEAAYFGVLPPAAGTWSWSSGVPFDLRPIAAVPRQVQRRPVPRSTSWGSPAPSDGRSPSSATTAPGSRSAGDGGGQRAGLVVGVHRLPGRLRADDGDVGLRPAPAARPAVTSGSRSLDHVRPGLLPGHDRRQQLIAGDLRRADHPTEASSPVSGVLGIVG
ncbi:hypothetical protein HBB16_06585 [Pseudonocardia sp. MCCB 268]|nr:hypothetical protein [Pseudonocardia cytotoxica]